MAVREVSFEVAEGEPLMLLGGSGSGKTATLETINRLVEPTSGRVTLRGEDVAGLVPHELRLRIGYCFQRIGLFPHMTVAENIGISPRLLGWDPDKIAARVEQLLETVELEDDRGAIDDHAMRDMNRAVDVDGRDAREVGRALGR